MGEAALTFGKAGSIEFEGRAYPISPLLGEDLGAFEVWCEDQAWSKVERTRGRCTEEAYQGRLDSVTRLVAVGGFGYGGDLAARASASDAGQRYLAYLQLAKLSPGMTEELASKIVDHDRALARARLAAANGHGGPDPNLPPPASP